MIRFGVITAYPEEDWHRRRILAACARRGEVTALRPIDFSARVGGATREIRICGQKAESWDVFLTPRALGEQGEQDFQIEAYRALAQGGARIINSIDALLGAIDKYRTSVLFAAAGLPTPRVVVTQRLAEALSAVEEMGDAVVKPLYGSLGIGVARVRPGRRARAHLAESLSRFGALYVQQYVEAGGRDVRAFVVGGRVAASIQRIARRGELRANVHQGGVPVACQLGPDWEALALRAAAVVGLEYSGVDLVQGQAGPMLLEVNGTPLWEGIFQATGRDMAEEIAEHATRQALEAARAAA